MAVLIWFSVLGLWYLPKTFWQRSQKSQNGAVRKVAERNVKKRKHVQNPLINSVHLHFDKESCSSYALTSNAVTRVSCHEIWKELELVVFFSLPGTYSSTIFTKCYDIICHDTNPYQFSTSPRNLRLWIKSSRTLCTSRTTSTLYKISTT